MIRSLWNFVRGNSGNSNANFRGDADLSKQQDDAIEQLLSRPLETGLAPGLEQRTLRAIRNAQPEPTLSQTMPWIAVPSASLAALLMMLNLSSAIDDASLFEGAFGIPTMSQLAVATTSGGG